MHVKYIRHSEAGFVLWPSTVPLQHADVARSVEQRLGGRVVSAGFVVFCDDGSPICCGMSLSLDLEAQPGDSEDLAKQYRLPTPYPGLSPQLTRSAAKRLAG